MIPAQHDAPISADETPQRSELPSGAAAAAQYRDGRGDLNVDVAHSARIYDYWLGGKDNFAADRTVAEAIKAAVPEVPMMVRANRDWMLRVTRHLARDAGIRQFLDIGTGIPTTPNLHQAAQHIAPHFRVAYVDNDPLVLTHARALLTSDPRGLCEYLDADLRDIDQILASSALGGTLDLSQPVAVILASVLMLLSDADNPSAIVARLRDWAPAGSYLAISHPTADLDPEAMASVVDVTEASGMTFVPRSRAQVTEMFGDWDLSEPGLVPVLAWRPDAQPDHPEAAYYWTGVARKPARPAAGRPCPPCTRFP
ncbi:SAM-dependent methyltransferase [Actinoplanes sp. NPDC049118]|uniref:SAM-dependent methyltransferase n=1 Tax=Actinoplanes sp. NPDC049118 TaxID=3155769 RepID=UPI0034093571